MKEFAYLFVAFVAGFTCQVAEVAEMLGADFVTTFFATIGIAVYTMVKLRRY